MSHVPDVITTPCEAHSLFATAAVASSEFSNSSGAAAKATGEPSWNGCAAGLGSAWAPADDTTNTNWLRLTFDTALYVSAIRVWEAAQPAAASGFVRRVVAVEGNGTTHEYWRADDDDLTACGNVFTLSQAHTTYPVDQLILYTRTQSIGREHVDAVQIDGTTCPPARAIAPLKRPDVYAVPLPQTRAPHISA